MSGSGTVTRNPNAASYPSGTVVTLTATPGAGQQFNGWSGDLTGTANPATITMNANKSVTATFAPHGQHVHADHQRERVGHRHAATRTPPPTRTARW